MIQAIVFDFDGVLADSEPCHLAALQDVLGSVGLPLTREDYYARYLGLDDDGLFRTLAAERGLPLDDAAVAALIAQKSVVFDDLVASGEILYPGAAECVERLAADFPLGIASGALRHEIERVLVSAGLHRHIRFIVASGETPRSKPYPDPYARGAELHGLPPATCLAIEDSRWGIESARSAGLRCVGITNTYPAAELAAADRVIDSLAEFDTALIRGI